MAHKHQVKVSSANGRTGAARKYRRQMSRDLRRLGGRIPKGGAKAVHVRFRARGGR